MALHEWEPIIAVYDVRSTYRSRVLNGILHDIIIPEQRTLSPFLLQYYLVATTSTDLKKSTLAKLYTLVCIGTGKSLPRAESQASTEPPYGVRAK